MAATKSKSTASASRSSGKSRSSAGRRTASHTSKNARSSKSRTASRNSSAKTASSRSGSTRSRSGSGRSASGSTGRSSGSGQTRQAAAGRRTSAVSGRSGAVREYSWTSEVSLFIIIAVCIVLFISNFGAGGTFGRVFQNVCFGSMGVISYLFPIWLFIFGAFLISNRHSSRAAASRTILKACAGVLLLLFLCAFAHLIHFLGESHSFSWYYEQCGSEKIAGGVIGAAIGQGLATGFGLAGAFVIDIAVLVIAIVLLRQRALFSGVTSRSREAAELARQRRMERAEERHQERLENYVIEEERKRQKREEEHRKRTKEKLSGLDGFSEPLKNPGQEGTVSGPETHAEDATEYVNPEDMDRIAQIKAALAGIKREQEAEQKAKEDELRRKILKDAGVEEEIRPRPSKKKKTEKTEETADIHKKAADLKAAFAEAEEKIPMPEIHMPEPIRPPEGLMKEKPQLELDLTPEELMNEQLKKSEVSAETKEHRKKKNPASSPEDNAAVEAEIQEGAQKRPVRDYVFPESSLLALPDPRNTGDSRQHLEAMSKKLQLTLTNFGVDARVTNVTCGPSVTRYEIQPAMGVKVSKIVNLADDIKLNLAVADIRIEAPIPGKAAIGIEVPNSKNVTVSLREMIESEEFRKAKSKLTFCVGKDIAGKIIIADIAKMPHLLIAGATGSGKSVCINTIIMSVLFHASPDEVKMIMIDPKVVELSTYNGIPHLMLPVVTDPKKAAGALNWAVSEMNERYRKFAEYHVRDMSGYNQIVDSYTGPEEERPEKMPQILIIVDELADLMMAAPGDVEGAICRLAQLARAAGLHLVIATQRPSVNVITGLIKANMPSRIAFSVTSGVDSRTILDMNGAEKLLGKGDMLYYPQNFQKPLRVQGAFVSDQEVSKVVEAIIRENGDTDYDPQIEEQVKEVAETTVGGGTGGAAPGKQERDMYFRDAGRFVIEKEKGSIGMLQRMFKIGFNRAARIMDQLEAAGVVGPEEGTKPRRVLMTAEEFEAFLQKES